MIHEVAPPVILCASPPPRSRSHALTSRSQRLGIDPSVPLAVCFFDFLSALNMPLIQILSQVQQWNGLIAVNYPAREFGITRHESPAEALKKCPNIMLVHCATYR